MCHLWYHSCRDLVRGAGDQVLIPVEVIIVTTMFEMGLEAVKNSVSTSLTCLLVVLAAVFALK